MRAFIACALASVMTLTAWAQGTVSASVPPASAYTDPETLRILLTTSSRAYVLVDVRTREEYAAGHIPLAVNVPYDAIGERPPTADTSELVVVYCASGKRSAQAAAALRAKGYSNVADFGSVRRWKWPLVEAPGPGECPCLKL